MSSDTQAAPPKPETEKSFEAFLSNHELQLYGIQFPKELNERLYTKLYYEIFDTSNFFEIYDDPNENRYYLKAKRPIKKNDNVFLIDHAWTFKLRKMNEYLKGYPKLVNRICKMLKYSDNKKDLINKWKPSLIQVKEEDKKKSIEEYNTEIAAKDEKDLCYDEYKITSDTYEILIKPTNTTETLSIRDNEIDNFILITETLDTYQNIKALWAENNPFCKLEENYEQEIYNNHKNIQILNRKITPNLGEWGINYLLRQSKNLEDSYIIDYSVFKKYDSLYSYNILLDLSSRDPLSQYAISKNNLDAYSKYLQNKNIFSVDISDNDYEFNIKDNSIEGSVNKNLISFLKAFPKSLENIIIDDEDDIFETLNDDIAEDLEQNGQKENENLQTDFTTYKNSLFTNCELLKIIVKEVPNIKYINRIPIYRILEAGGDKKKLIKIKREYFVNKNIWKISRTYRLVSMEKFDEDAIWYLNDEYGTYINHSDVPNFSMFPFLFSKTNDFKEESLISYSILWPTKDIYVGDEIFVDYLANINEEEERSARLTVWCNTPKLYFVEKFYDKMKKLNQKKESDVEVFSTELNKLIEKIKNKDTSINVEEEIKKIFNFDLCKESEKESPSLTENTIKNIIQAINSSVTEKESDKNIFKDQTKFNESHKIRICTDLSNVKNNLTIANIEYTKYLNEADIIWISKNVFELLEPYKITANDLKEKNLFLNQFPYENIIALKNNLSSLIQKNIGINDYINISYFMKSELAELIGNYYYNQDNNYDNTWILKPINMTRSMDMAITNNIDEIIRYLETGPKLCQKYINNCYLMNNKKFDLRFIICLKKLIPLELYFYTNMFWIRSSNKEYYNDDLSFNDYETHFTVMNYGEFHMQTIYDKDFIEYFEKHENKKWKDIYDKLKLKIKNVFLMALKDCPQMINSNCRSIYGLDAMIDKDYEPHIIEINFQPDCTRACNFVPSYYNDIFNTLYFDNPSGVEMV